MAGIYIHVPFCKVKCHYCDFHFSTQLNNRGKMVDAMLKELALRKNYLGGEGIDTIYFGGGTPSVLEGNFIGDIIKAVRDNYDVNSGYEMTLECNPDDLDEHRLAELAVLGINRLSIGIQSFDDDVLQFMNRAHNSSQARNAVLWAKKAGFDNITIDLIYGVPGSTPQSWANELSQMLDLGVPHLSAYCLTIEENTVFGNWLKKGQIKAFADDESLVQFQYLMDFAKANGYDQYEISNFGKPNYFSRHNSAYWQGKKYLGIGPSAHSYDQETRGWNMAHNIKYIQAIENNRSFFEDETLSQKDRFNEYLLIRLRTKWGLDLTDMCKISAQMTEQASLLMDEYVQENKLQKNGSIYTLTDHGKYIADSISADLFQ